MLAAPQCRGTELLLVGRHQGAAGPQPLEREQLPLLKTGPQRQPPIFLTPLGRKIVSTDLSMCLPVLLPAGQLMEWWPQPASKSHWWQGHSALAQAVDRVIMPQSPPVPSGDCSACLHLSVSRLCTVVAPNQGCGFILGSIHQKQGAVPGVVAHVSDSSYLGG